MAGQKAFLAVDVKGHPLSQLTQDRAVEFEIVSSKSGEGGAVWWVASGNVNPIDLPRVTGELKSLVSTNLVKIISLAGPVVVEARVEAFDAFQDKSRCEFIPLRVSAGRFLCIVSGGDAEALHFAVEQLRKQGVDVEILKEEPRVLCG